MAWCLPATTATRTQHVSLKSAFGVHVLTALLVTLLVIILVNVPDSLANRTQIAHYVVAIEQDLISLWEELAQNWFFHSFLFVMTVLSIEAAFGLLALAIAPWGARDEPMRASLRQAFKTVWLQSAQALVVVLLVGGLGAVLETMERSWDASYEIPEPPTLVLPTKAAPGTPEYQEWQKAMDEYHAERGEWWWANYLAKPWYLRDRELFVVISGFVSALWVIWALLRAVGAPRDVSVLPRPPTCEWCGYNLTTIAMEGRCPECGESVASSLGPGVRSGTMWQRRKDIGRIRAWWPCTLEAISRPTRFGRQLRITPAGTDHRRFLAVHLPFAFLIGLAFVSALALIVGQSPGRGSFAGDIVLPTILFGCAVLAAMVAISLVSACIIGLYFRITERRNLLAPSAQAACYLATYMTLWTAFAVAEFVMIILHQQNRFLYNVADWIGVDGDLLGLAIWFVPNIALFIGYLTLIARITASTRYSNS